MPARALDLPGDIGDLSAVMLEAAKTARIGVIVSLVDRTPPRNVYVSEAAAEILGWPEAELRERDPMTNIAPEDLPRMRERLALRGGGLKGHARYELAVLRKDGTRAHIELSASDILLDGKRAVFTFVTDIGARKEAEQAQRQANQCFRDLIENAPEPIGIFRDAEHLAYVNRAYVRVLGYDSAEELVAQPVPALLSSEAEAGVVRERAARILGSGEALAAQTYRVKRKDGATVLLEASGVPIEYEGRPAILAMARDVTDRKRLQEQLVQADRLAALGTMAAGVAHEINNPLAYVMLNLDWIGRKLPEVARDAQTVDALLQLVEEARQGAERVAAIVRELRSFSRADGETRRVVQVADVVRSAIKLVGHEVRHRARIDTTFEPAPPVLANEARLEQVVINLLLNAAQAMPDGRADNEVRAIVRTGANANAVLEIVDNGEGIPPEVLPRIFDPFFTTKPPGVGTGLGLSICHGIVAALGGQITVRSDPGEGTTFRIVLPATALEAQPVSPRARRSEPPRAPGPRARVLVIDDEPPIASALRDLLAHDHDVVATTSARDALATLRTGSDFDVVFCDLMMPDVNGVDLYERIRVERPGLEARIVFMTGGAFTAQAADFLSSIPNRRVEKPFDMELVERIVRELASRDRIDQ